MTAFEVPRSDLVGSLVSRIRESLPFLLCGPPGAGKTTLLRRAADALSAEGWVPVYLDLMAAASSPDRFVVAALEALPAKAFGTLLPRATEIRRLAAGGRERGAEAVRELFALWGSLPTTPGQPVALLLDEATEIRSLAYFPGLREVHKPFLASLQARPRGTVLATSFPTLADRLWPGIESLAVGALSAEDVSPLGSDPVALIGASSGWPRYVRILLERLDEGVPLEAAWAQEMALGGRLESACRHTYETLLLRSRGYGISKAALAAVAREEGLNLTALVTRLGRTPGATRDYLQWLVGVDALRMVKKRYYYVDGLVRWWVRLYGGGTLPTAEDLRAAAGEAVESAAEEAAAPVPEPALPRRDSLIEID